MDISNSNGLPDDCLLGYIIGLYDFHIFLLVKSFNYIIILI